MVVRANPEKKEEKERIRAELFRATLRLAAAHGFASLGLREVSREALIAPTSFYRHFEDMEELGLALIDEKIGPLVASVAAVATEAGDAGDAGDPRAIARALFEAADGDPELVRFLLAERVGGIPRFRAAIDLRLQTLAAALALAASVSAAAARALVAILVDAAFRHLESPENARDALLAETATQFEIVTAGAERIAKRSAR